jgi:amino acid adenylation domain-containing protein
VPHQFLTPDHPFVGRLLELPPSWRDRSGVSSATANLSFEALGAAMMHFAGWLSQTIGVGMDDRVAICLPKSLEAVQAIYGTLAAGACYVPLPFHGPPIRLAASLETILPKLLLTTAATAAQLARTMNPGRLPPIRTVEPRDDGGGLMSLIHDVPPLAQIAGVSPDHLAAIYFTSGSTGEPKGVMLSDLGIATTLASVQRRDRMNERDRRISHAGLQFVASLDLFFPLFGGCHVSILPESEAMFPERVADVLEREKPTIWSCQTTVMRLLLERGNLFERNLQSLRRVAFFGEPIPLATLRQLMAAVPQADFLNHYGATEAYNMANFLIPRPLPENMTTLPLGEPADHCAMTLRDEAGREVGPAEAGEICVTSKTVMLGYWGDPELTATKRFDGRSDSFRTGDLAVAGEDGMFRLLGRKDNLIKIRGHRFHLGEIEATLKLHPAVRAAFAFAITRRDGKQEIRAAVLADVSDLEMELRRHCSRRLPAFARPAVVATMDRFPLLANGKVDRRALQALVEGR